MYLNNIFNENEKPILWDKNIDDLYDSLRLKFTKLDKCKRKISICIIKNRGIDVKTIWSDYTLSINLSNDKFINNLNEALKYKEILLPIEVIYAVVHILYDNLQPQCINCVKDGNSSNIIFGFTQ